MVDMSGKWLEHIRLITAKEFVQKYGRKGSKVNDMCSFTEEEYLTLNDSYGDRILPISLGKVEFLLRAKK